VLLKICLAVERGHHNVAFLFLLAIAASLTMAKRKAPVRTPRGDGLLADLKTRFHRLEKRAEDIKLGGASRELVILAAVFGMTALPLELHAQMGALFPRAMASAGSGSCGSSCGSSCSSSSSCGGSSCGGGGCGGGCGGCG
jgi:hypothetical protein